MSPEVMGNLEGLSRSGRDIADQLAWSRGAPLPRRCVRLVAVSGDVTREPPKRWQLPSARCASWLSALGSMLGRAVGANLLLVSAQNLLKLVRCGV